MSYTGEVISAELQVHAPQQVGTMVSLNTIFLEGITVVKFMRRFGCPLTRYEANELSQFKEAFSAMNVRLVGIGFDTSGVKAFISGGFWNSELYLDPKRSLYKYFNLRRAPKLRVLQSFLNPETRKLYSLAKRTLRGNLRGDSLQMGATFIIDRDGSIVYSFTQKDFADFPKPQTMLDICRSNQTKTPYMNAKFSETQEMLRDLSIEELISVNTFYTRVIYSKSFIC